MNGSHCSKGKYYIFLGALIAMQFNSLSLFAQPDSISLHSNLYYGPNGLHLESDNGNFATNLDLRLQLRYSYPFEQDPRSLEDFNQEEQHIMQIRRARLKIGGHAFTPRLTYYMEFAFETPELIDFYATYSFCPAFKILVGQYKVRYNTEKMVSSGKQTMSNRSLIDRAFTIDRQTGITFLGNLAGNGMVNFSYWVAVLSGTGAGGFVPDDNHLMYQARLQWNLFGQEMKFESSDIGRESRWRGFLAVAAVTNQSQFTRFTQSGGRQLQDYPDPSSPGQYRINQVLAETAFKKNGVSWQQEFHWKQIHDTEDNSTESGIGLYAQLGTFPVSYLSGFPEKLEVAGRYAYYKPETNSGEYSGQEFSFCLNWFFRAHRNKLTSEVAYLVMEENDVTQPGWRFRFQWDVSL